MRILLTMLFVFSYIISSSQTDKVLVCDETWVVKSGEKAFRIITTNDSVAHAVMSIYEQDMTRFTYTRKKDRGGVYWERSFYFPKEKYEEVLQYIRKKFG